ncbi:MAG: response regulator [Rhodospirillales bacterium]|nr:response regulator [Rhodospirillales bacterium]
MKIEKSSDLKILSIDDDPSFHDVIGEILRELGIPQLESKTSAIEALEYIREKKGAIDVILCDLFMPDMDGIEFMLKLADSGHKGPIAIISRADNEIITLAQELAEEIGLWVLGAVKKPVSVGDLRALIFR